MSAECGTFNTEARIKNQPSQYLERKRRPQTVPP
jgi:hypothetical protein